MTPILGPALARDLARVHAARVAQGFWGKPITQTLLRAAEWDGSARGLRGILVHYREEFSRESDRHQVGNAHIGRMEIWAGTRWPEASNAWRWSYQWAPDHTGRLIGTAAMESGPAYLTVTPGWWLTAILLDYRPVLEQVTPEQVAAWAPRALERIASADSSGGLGGIAVDWVREMIKTVRPDTDLTIPAFVTPAHVRSLYRQRRGGDHKAAIVSCPLGDVRVDAPHETDRVLYTGQELSQLLHHDLDPEGLDSHIVEGLIRGIQGRVDADPREEYYLREVGPAGPHKLWQEREFLAKALAAHFEGRDLVLAQDPVYRHRLVSRALAAERGWKVLDVTALVARVRITPQTPLWESALEEETSFQVRRAAQLVGGSHTLYWTTP